MLKVETKNLLTDRLWSVGRREGSGCHQKMESPLSEKTVEQTEMGGRKETRSVLDILNFKYVLDIQVDTKWQLISH